MSGDGQEIVVDELRERKGEMGGESEVYDRVRNTGKYSSLRFTRYLASMTGEIV